MAEVHVMQEHLPACPSPEGEGTRGLAPLPLRAGKGWGFLARHQPSFRTGSGEGKENSQQFSNGKAITSSMQS